MGEELVVHPRRALHRERLSLQHDLAARLQAREGDVVRSLPRSGCLLADPVQAVDHRRLQRPQVEAERESRIDRLYPLRSRTEVPRARQLPFQTRAVLERAPASPGPERLSRSA